MSQILSDLKPVQSVPKPFNPRTQEIAWLAQHRHEYLGQWIAVDGPHLIANGNSLKEVLDSAHAKGHLRPLVDHVPKELPELPFGGW